MPPPDTMKPAGAWEVRRGIEVPSLTSAADAFGVERAINELPGVRKVFADGTKHRVVVRYDASQTDYQTIMEAIGATGQRPSESWWSRVKGNWYQFCDTNSRENANAPPPPCCNKPPK